MDPINNYVFWLLCISLVCLAISLTDGVSLLENSKDATKATVVSKNKALGYTLGKADLRPRSDIFSNGKSSEMEDVIAEKVAGGYAAPRSTYIHVAHVSVTKVNGKSGACTGTILNSTTILSAAHCFWTQNDKIKVRSAEIRVGGLSNGGPRYIVKSVVIFKRFQRTSYGHDIAIIILFKSLNKRFKPIEFQSCSKCFPQPGEQVFAAGFGITDEEGSKTRRLLETSLVVRPFALCKETYSVIRPIKFGKFHTFCAMDEKFPGATDTALCKGDSGGPAFIKKGKSGFVQLGIQSFGSPKCNMKGGINWLINVSFYQPAINSFLKGRENQWRNVYNHPRA